MYVPSHYARFRQERKRLNERNEITRDDTSLRMGFLLKHFLRKKNQTPLRIVNGFFIFVLVLIFLLFFSSTHFIAVKLVLPRRIPSLAR